MSKSLVQNAADSEQVKKAARKEENTRERQLNDIRAILGTVEGRRFIMRLLDRCHLFRSIWEPSAKIHFNAGEQNIGNFILAEVIEAEEDALMMMMKESKSGV